MTSLNIFKDGKNKNIFAIGDCCDVKEEKMAIKVKDHAKVVSHNIEQVVNNTNKFKEYKPSILQIMIASIGRNNGIFQLGPVTFKGFLPTMLKSKDLFVPRYRKMLGYNVAQRSEVALSKQVVSLL